MAALIFCCQLGLLLLKLPRSRRTHAAAAVRYQSRSKRGNALIWIALI
jgi:hypothetical protein